MASEYLQWKYRDIQPDEKKELTAREKRANWWHYHKWYIAIGAAAVLILVDIGSNVIKEKTDTPDYQIAYVGTDSLPDDTVAELENLFASIGEDLDGDGTVTVRINQYASHTSEDETSEDNSGITTIVGSDSTSAVGAASGTSVMSGSADAADYATASQVTLLADMESCDSFFFLLEDPEQFQKDYEILSYTDGTLPGEYMTDYENCCIAFTDSAVLTETPLGSYSETIAGETITGSSDDLVDRLYLARRGFWTDQTCRNEEGCEALWNKIIRGTN